MNELHADVHVRNVQVPGTLEFRLKSNNDAPQSDRLSSEESRPKVGASSRKYFPRFAYSENNNADNHSWEPKSQPNWIDQTFGDQEIDDYTQSQKPEIIFHDNRDLFNSHWTIGGEGTTDCVL